MRKVIGLSLNIVVALLSPGNHVLAEPPTMSEVSGSPVKWDRAYKPGETLKYEMNGTNQGWEYQIQADITVKRDDEGIFYEEVAWSNLRSNAPMTLSPASLAFRQQLSLDGSGKHIAIPDLSRVQTFLIGPITDTLTFYSDLLIAKQEKLSKVGQHAYFAHGTPNSWADGQHVILGQDSIDFDLTLVAANNDDHTATLLIRHVPPKNPQVHLLTSWMKAPVSDAPNNWVQVEHSDSKYIVEVGKETFDARIMVDTRDGKILSVDLDNPIVAISRECSDAALSQCGTPTPQEIHRKVSLKLVP